MGYFKNENLEKLEKEYEQAQHELEVQQHVLNRTKQKIKNLSPDSRKIRNRRLIRKGIAFEYYFPETELFNEEETKQLMEALHQKAEVRTLVREHLETCEEYLNPTEYE